MKELIDAIKNSDIKQIDALLSNNHDLLEERFVIPVETAFFTIEKKRFTPLGYAAFINNEAITKYLIKLKANPFNFDMKGVCPLDYIALAGYNSLLTEIAQNLQNTNVAHVIKMWVMSLMRYGISIDQIDASIAPFLNAGIDPLDLQPTHILFHLSRHGLPLDRLQYLEKMGADINAISEEGCSIADYALLLPENKTATYLFNKGVKPRINKKGISTLYHAALHGTYPSIADLYNTPDEINLLCPCTNGSEQQTTLHRAIERKKIIFVQNLLNHSPDLTIKGINGRSPLLESIFHCQFTITQLLIDYGADVLDIDSNGNTSLHLLMQQNGRSGHSDLLTWSKKLIQLGCQPSATNLKGETAIDLGKQANCPLSILKLLSS